MSLERLTQRATRREAEELRFLLEGAGIPCVLQPEAGTNGGPAGFLLLVRPEHLEQARRVLAEEEPPPLPAPTNRRVPLLAALALVAANVAAWVVLELAGGSEDRRTLLRLGASHAPSLARGEWWRTITAVFLHIGPRHLLTNMVALLLLGPPVAEAWGVGRGYLLYLAAGVAGNEFSFALSPRDTAKAGASGAILGLLGVLAGTRVRAIRAPGARPGRYKTWHIVAMVLAFYGFVVGTGHADHLAHVGGLLAGAALVFVVPPPGRLSPRADRLTGAASGGAALLATLVAALLAWRAA